jgi:hypothetical protein
MRIRYWGGAVHTRGGVHTACFICTPAGLMGWPYVRPCRPVPGRYAREASEGVVCLPDWRQTRECSQGDKDEGVQ